MCWQAVAARPSRLAVVLSTAVALSWPVTAYGHQGHAPRTGSAVQPPGTQPARSGAPAKGVGLDVVARDGVKVPEPNLGKRDFGPLSVLQTRYLRQAFRLRNASDAVFVRLVAAVSCEDCMRCFFCSEAGAKWTALPENGALPDLKPRETLDIRVELDLAEIHERDVVRSVVIGAGPMRQAAALLEVSATVVQPVEFAPVGLDFGVRQAKSGDPCPIRFALHVNPLLTPAGWSPQLVSSSPYVTIESLPLDEKDIKRSALVPRNIRAIGSFSFRAVLNPHAAIGPLSGAIRIGYIKDGKGNAASPPSVQLRTLNAILRDWTLPFVGRVVGDISALPSSAVFGRVEPGKQAVQRVTLTAADRSTFSKMQFFSTSRWVSVRMLGDQSRIALAGNRPSSRVMEILIDSAAPAGNLRGTVSVALPDGQHVDIPVTALVAPPKPAAAAPKSP